MKIAFFELKDQDKKEFYTKSLKDHKLYFSEQVLDQANIPDTQDFEVISVFVKSKIDQKVIDSFPNLKMIAVRATGFNNVDCEYAKQKNIAVVNVPVYGSHTVAEFTFTLILSLTRKIKETLKKEQTDFNYQGLKGDDLYQKTLGVIGTGKIGLNVIKIARAFEMKVLAFDVFRNQEAQKDLGFEYVELDQLLGNSDIITLHAPATPKTNHLINKDSIHKIKKGAILINTARGTLIETDALIEALQKGILKAAGLDVLEEENSLNESFQTYKNHPLANMKNVIFTPHMAFYTKEAENNIQNTTLENILSLDSNEVKNKVN